MVVDCRYVMVVCSRNNYMKIVTERLTERDIEMARVYLRRVLEHPSVVESLVNGLVVKATQIGRAHV